MHSQLRERIRLMRARLDNAAPVAEIRAESQLFVTPAPVCDRLVMLAEISNRDHILEPSAGTGAILRAIRDTAPGAMCDAVEINSGLVRYLRENFNGVRVQCGDFMEWQPVQYYSRVIMNPPFSHGQDIRHILRAFSLLRPGGVLVAVCLNGPRQQEKLLPFSDVREELPRGTFAYTDVVDTTFDDKVRQHATTEMQVTAAQMQKQYEEIRRELDVLNKQRGDDQRRIEKLGQDNAALAEQVKALGANPVTATGEPVPQMPASPPGPEGEPQPGNTPVSFPPQGSVAVPPPTAFYPGNGVTPPPQVTYQSVPVPNRIQRKVFTRNEGKQGPSLPYIPSGSFAKAMLIEGADANASVTGNESTVPMQLRITGLVEMPNSKTYDATGCFVGLEAWGDVSSERAIVRTRNISCLKDGKTIDMPIKGHVSFRGKNGIKGEVVMRNGKILGWAWGAGFVDGIGQGMERASQPAVGLGATAAYGAGDVLKMGIGGGASKAAQTLSDYYIKRAEQYHPVIPIGAGNEVTVVFQDGFQLKTVEEMALERTQSRAEEDNPESPVPVPPSAESHLNGFNTDQMLKQLGNLNPQQFMSGSQGGGNDGK
ncbi:F-type conjugal transfer pilus assembly protein TraB [Escherichia coli]|nr:F-type conjugal transfer pilus assembly protein TraB [Escherichia coli]